MKKIKKLLTIGLAVLLMLCISVSLAGCKKGWYADEHKFLYERMNEISIEYSGYSLEENNTDYMIQHKGGEYTCQDEKLIVSYGDSFKINFKNNETIIDVAFMEERSTVYNDINKIWEGKLEKGGAQETSEIEHVVVFDNKIFIITEGLKVHLAGSVKGETPYVLYYYDIDADMVYYCGFYSGELNEYECYDGFRPDQQLMIVKVQKCP